jgi:hypothetical protein
VSGGGGGRMDVVGVSCTRVLRLRRGLASVTEVEVGEVFSMET